MKTNTQKKKLVIITGITGAIGNAFLAKYSREENTAICGISRKAEDVSSFINPENNKFFPATFIANLGDLTEQNIKSFAEKINYNEFESATYVHGLGLYPFEINKIGQHVVENDKDGDGINDTVLELSHRVFKFFVENLSKNSINSGAKFASVIFGGIADVHKPLAHQSWWRVMGMTKDYMKKQKDNIGMNLINISSVVCSHEIITRPHVFTQTDADLKYWLLPHEIPDRFFAENENMFSGYHEYEFFHIRPNFDPNYYENFKFTPRKVKEIFHK